MKTWCFFSWSGRARMIPGLFLAFGNVFFLHGQSGWQPAPAPNSVCLRSGLSFRGTLLAGTDGLGVYRREAAGRWVAEEPGDSMGQVRAMLEYNGHVFAIGSDAVWKRNADSRWTSILPLPDAESEFLDIYQHGNSLFLGWTYGILRSDDSGRSWKESGGQLEGKAIHNLISWRNDLWAESEGSVYRSDAQGKVWYPDNDGLPAGFRELSFSTDGDSLFVLDAQYGLFVYDDGNWRQLDIPGGVRAMLAYGDDLYVAGEAGVFKRVERRGAWLHLNGLPVSVHAATVLLPGSDGVLLGTNHQGFWRLPDSNAFAMQEETGIRNTRISSMSAVDGECYLTTRFAGALHASSDSGNNWKGVFGGRLPAVDGTVHRKSGLLHWLGTSAGLWLSRDGAKTWNEIPLFRRQRIHDILQTDDGWLIAGMAGTVFKTSDTGLIWQFAGSGFRRPGVSQLLRVGPVLYAATYGGLYQSRNQGREWHKVDSGLPVWEAAAHIACIDGVLYLSTFESGLFWSHDSGRSFELLHNQFSEWSIVKLVGSGNLLFCTDGGKVYFSSDLGMNWKPLMHGLPYRTAISDLCLYGNHCWAATEGKGLWRLPIASATVEPGPELLKPECRIWPVPASDYIHVRITRPGQQYQICNMSGSVLRAGRLSRMETRIELQGLPPAPYLLRWTSDAGYGVRMFVKE
jgi:photosystem II stability/assembly factor-like uncharacterized protein